VIATEKRTHESDRASAEKLLIEEANRDGVVTLYWTAPADAAPGHYAIVIHGLDTQIVSNRMCSLIAASLILGVI
jgi:hypothetical protein